MAHQLKDTRARVVVTKFAALDTVKAAYKTVRIANNHIALLGHDSNPNGRYKHWKNVRSMNGTSRYRRQRSILKMILFLVTSP